MRVRATVLLVRHHAVLLVRERGGPWLLPGGTVELDELPIVAAIRALHEESGVEASAAAFLFQQVSAHHLHHVFRIAIPDDVHPRAAMGGGLDEVLWAEPSRLAHMSITPGTRAILNRAIGLGYESTKPHRDPNGMGAGKRWR
ncbi:NUDIX domain-containing protein [Caballeronia ptereochthonis]|uniref:NUDIX hydrolase n=1 Tax=Caballeronia ptereochthonis TaxID=1777144 RepID=A0A158B2J8_9BURK|nr:NUDIX domain-containing protein [Caballeronia ptereochthonis]SAK63966.1 NUDIX hydrolase [Caballeronia ptereochthonis]